ncbi:membrane protein FAM174-like isoform X2 [Hydra vulgaris]|uniref:Membrane protein FAM174-like isoform X2 n=1 Tax=Hydra vulgaris TaxID=6087 RepID=A0ABM4BFG7_HYDVU
MEKLIKHAVWVVWFISNILLSSAQNNSTSSPDLDITSTSTTISRISTTPSSNKTSLPHIAMRTIYVVSAVSALVIVYLIIRAACSRRKKSRTKRYGVLKNNRSDGMELHPLSEADDDDDDDMTLFDLRQQRKVKP